MSQKLIMIEMPPNDIVSKTDKFIINDLNPICIRGTNVENTFIILFFAHQDLRDEAVFLQTMFVSDNPDLIKASPYYKDNILKNEDNKKKYDIILKELNKNNLYATDFDVMVDPDYPNYYYGYGVKAITRSNAEKLEIFFNKETYIILRLFLQRFLITYDFHFAYFINPIYKNMQFVNIEKIKYDASVRRANFPIDGVHTIFSHYTMNCGPSAFKMTYLTVEKNQKALANPMINTTYDTLYGKDITVDNIVYDDISDCIYIIYFKVGPIDDSIKTYVLVLNKDMYSKTNFLDAENVIYNKEK